MEKENLSFGTKDEQLKLLRLILSASDADAEEEDLKEELFDGTRESRVSCLNLIIIFFYIYWSIF